MPINYQQVYDQVRHLVVDHQLEQQELQRKQTELDQTFTSFDLPSTEIERRVEIARRNDTGLRCAQPTEEHIHTNVPAPALMPGIILIASDGSQIMPDRHSPARFGLINTGAIVMTLGSGDAPDTMIESNLLPGDKLITENGTPITDSMLGLMRDAEERITLLRLVEQASQPEKQVITLSDGPIELWGRKDGEEGAYFEQNLRKYLAALSQIRDQGAWMAGYIDRPGANPVARMLELTQADDNALAEFKAYHPFEGVSDLWLFAQGAGRLLPGHRSCVFKMRSKAESDYSGSFEIHFFYINVGASANEAQIARVEVPAWVAMDETALGQAHRCILDQCSLLGARPFPYLLHRAHEIAVVSQQDKLQIEEYFQIESLNVQAGLGVASNKQIAKNAAGRSRYQ